LFSCQFAKEKALLYPARPFHIQLFAAGVGQEGAPLSQESLTSPSVVFFFFFFSGKSIHESPSENSLLVYSAFLRPLEFPPPNFESFPSLLSFPSFKPDESEESVIMSLSSFGVESLSLQYDFCSHESEANFGRIDVSPRTLCILSAPSPFLFVIQDVRLVVFFFSE